MCCSGDLRSPKSEYALELSYVKFSNGEMIVTSKSYVQPRVKTSVFRASKPFLSIVDHLQATFITWSTCWVYNEPLKTTWMRKQAQKWWTNWQTNKLTDKPNTLPLLCMHAQGNNPQTNQTLYPCCACTHRVNIGLLLVKHIFNNCCSAFKARFARMLNAFLIIYSNIFSDENNK